MKISDETKKILKDALFLLGIGEDTFEAMAEDATNTNYFIDSILDELQERGYVSFIRGRKNYEKYLAMNKLEGQTFAIDVGGEVYFIGKVLPEAANEFAAKLREYFAASGDDEYKVEIL